MKVWRLGSCENFIGKWEELVFAAQVCTVKVSKSNLLTGSKNDSDRTSDSGNTKDNSEHINSLTVYRCVQGGPGQSGCGYGNFELIGPRGINFTKRSTSWVSRVLFFAAVINRWMNARVWVTWRRAVLAVSLTPLQQWQRSHIDHEGGTVAVIVLIATVAITRTGRDLLPFEVLPKFCNLADQ